MTRPPHLVDPAPLAALHGDKSRTSRPRRHGAAGFTPRSSTYSTRSGSYPVTSEDIIDAIGHGVHDAVTQYLDRHGLPESSEYP